MNHVERGSSLNIILWEIRKLIKLKKNKLIFILYCCLIFTFIMNCIQKDKSEIASKLELAKYNKMSIFRLVNQLEAMAEGSKRNAEKMKFLKTAEVAKQLPDLYERKISAIKSGNRRDELEANIEIVECEKVLYGKYILSEQTESVIKFQDRYLPFLYHLREKNIALPNLYEMNGWNFVYVFLRVGFPLALLTLPILLLVNIVSDDRDTGSVKFLLMQPFSRVHILASKLVAGVLYSFVFLVSPIIVSFVILTVVYGKGASNVPVLEDKYAYDITEVRSIYNEKPTLFLSSAFRDTEQREEQAYWGISEIPYYVNDQGIFVPIKNYNYEKLSVFIVTCVPFILMFLIVESLLATLISVIAHNGANSLVIGILSICATFGIYIGAQSAMRNSMVLGVIPTNYVNVVQLLGGMKGQTIGQGYVIMILWIGILWAVASLVYKKQDLI